MGADDVNDRLGLAEIDPAIEEGPAGKFSRFRQASPGGKHQFEDESQDSRTAVAVDLDDILTGVTVRGGHVRDQDFVQALAGNRVRDPPVVQSERAEAMLGRAGPEQIRDNGASFRAADFKNANAPLAWRSGNGTNGVTGG